MGSIVKSGSSAFATFGPLEDAVQEVVEGVLHLGVLRLFDIRLDDRRFGWIVLVGLGVAFVVWVALSEEIVEGVRG